MKTIGLMMLLLGGAGSAMASLVAQVPEIDTSSSIGALTLLSGAMLVIQGRRRKR